jgi:exo-1,4-beta-D-glucosaminidase
MMPRWTAVILISFLLASATIQAQSATHGGIATVDALQLREGWTIQSSSKVEKSGEVVSTPKFQPVGWYAASVPTTVVAALVKLKVYPDPAFGMNLRKFPGVTYPIGENFSNIPMRQDSPFMVPWWFRKQFTLPASYKGKTIWLNFGGINYRGRIFLNGKQIADWDAVAGAWRTYEFDVTDAALPGKENVLAVEVFSPTEKDLAITFVDWNPAPPDKNMGLFRSVEIRTSGPVAVRYPAVVSKVDTEQKAHLTVTSLLKNSTKQPVKGVLKGSIEGAEFSQEVQFGPDEQKEVSFDPAQFAQLNFDHPRIWLPAQMGKPELYVLKLNFEIDGRTSDVADTKFGIREITSELNADGKRVFSINGKKILIRGGGWASDMMLRENSQRLRHEFDYVQDMGLNTIRLEGKLETKEFFDLADERGILVMAGWCCCDFWEQWPEWKPEDHTIAQQSLRDQIYRLRSHPSLLVWLNGSDNPPPAEREQAYLDVEKAINWPKPVISSATAKKAEVTGDSGVKMSGPYEYVSPNYWLLDTKAGGAVRHRVMQATGGAERMLHVAGPDGVRRRHAGSHHERTGFVHPVEDRVVTRPVAEPGPVARSTVARPTRRVDVRGGVHELDRCIVRRFGAPEPFDVGQFVQLERADQIPGEQDALGSQRMLRTVVVDPGLRAEHEADTLAHCTERIAAAVISTSTVASSSVRTNGGPTITRSPFVPST